MNDFLHDRNDIEQKRKSIVNLIESRTVTGLQDYVPYKDCVTDTNLRGFFQCYFTTSVGCSSVLAWLHTWVLNEVSLSTLLEEYAYFCVFLGNFRFCLPLTHGLLLYYDMVVFSDKTMTPKSQRFEQFSKEWVQSFYDNTKSESDMMLLCEQLVEKQRENLCKLLLTEQIQFRKQTNSNKIVAKEPLSKLMFAIVALFCLKSNSKTGEFFIQIFGHILPEKFWLQYHNTLIRVVWQIFGNAEALRIHKLFVNHKRLHSVKSEQKPLEFVVHSKKRSQIEEEKTFALAFVTLMRLSLLEYLNFFIRPSKKLSTFVHTNYESLLFLNTFRLHMCDLQNKSNVDFDVQTLKTPGIAEIRSENDPVVLCAPYCFCCGAFIDYIWPESYKSFPHLGETLKLENTYICSCNMARYCTYKCAKLHYSFHYSECCGEKVSNSKCQSTYTTAENVD